MRRILRMIVRRYTREGVEGGRVEVRARKR